MNDECLVEATQQTCLVAVFEVQYVSLSYTSSVMMRERTKK